MDASEDETVDVLDALDLGAAAELKLGDPERRPCVEQFERHLRVTAVAVSDTERDPAHERIVVDCFLGSNWILTVRGAESLHSMIFETLPKGKAKSGSSTHLVSHDTLGVGHNQLPACLRRDQETLDEIDVEAIAHLSKDLDEQLELLGDARRRVGRLRRTLAPHRDVFATLSHSEFDPLSSEASAKRFVALTARVDAALASARDVRDGIASSFDVLIVGTEHRTNEIVKILTLASILLLPGALLAGMAGMNVNISAYTFAHSPLFWVVVTAVILIAIATLAVARLRQWI